MNLRKTTSVEIFTPPFYLFRWYNHILSNHPPTPPKNSSNSLDTVFMASSHEEITEAEVDTPTCLLNITGDTYATEDIQIGDITRTNYMSVLVNFMFWFFDWHLALLVH